MTLLVYSKRTVLSMQCKNCPDILDPIWRYEVKGGIVCDQCIDHYKKCNSCGEYIHEDEIYELQLGNFCSDCQEYNRTKQDDQYEMLARTDPRF